MSSNRRRPADRRSAIRQTGMSALRLRMHARLKWRGARLSIRRVSFLDFPPVPPFPLRRAIQIANQKSKIKNFEAMAYKDVTPPAGGKISIQNGKLTVPENPVLPFIRGDGTGPDISAASQRSEEHTSH